MISIEQKKFIKKIKTKKFLILFTQLLLFSLFIVVWQYLVNKKYINSFITSSPLKIFNTIKNLYQNNNLFIHIFITLKECLIAFLITTLLSFLIAIIMYRFDFFAKVIEPYLITLNSLPKVALGPIIII